MSDSMESTATEQDEPLAVIETALVLQWVWPEPFASALSEDRVVLGRGDDCDIVLGGATVSRRHVELERDGDAYSVRDLASRNRTHVNGRAMEQARLVPGSVLRVGDWVGVLSLAVKGERIGFREVLPGVFGGSELARALEPLRRASMADLPVLLIGETGTGKERVARAVHDCSQRPGPFFAVNCAGLPETLAEAELFGYQRGAFTGAERTNLGHLRAADGGTLFLDEVADLPLGVQAKLLRVLEERAVRPLGKSESTPIDVRVVAAAPQPLHKLVREGRFRDDLLARLSGLVIRLPPLAERRADIVPLFLLFLRQLSPGCAPDLDSRLVEALCLHRWQHNVRGIEMLAKRLLAVHGDQPRLLLGFAPELRDGPPEQPAPRSSTVPPGQRAEEVARIAQALKAHDGNVKAAALSLGISRQRLYRLLDGRSPVDVATASSLADSDEPNSKGDIP